MPWGNRVHPDPCISPYSPQKRVVRGPKRFRVGWRAWVCRSSRSAGDVSRTPRSAPASTVVRGRWATDAFAHGRWSTRYVRRTGSIGGAASCLGSDPRAGCPGGPRRPAGAGSSGHQTPVIAVSGRLRPTERRQRLLGARRTSVRPACPLSHRPTRRRRLVHLCRNRHRCACAPLPGKRVQLRGNRGAACYSCGAIGAPARTGPPGTGASCASRSSAAPLNCAW